MSKIRVHELAKELNISSKEVIAFLQEKGIEVKAAQSSVEDDAIALVKDKFGKAEASKKEETAKEEADLVDGGLRYDLTVPLARYYANHANELPSPFKAMQIGNVWRADRPHCNTYSWYWENSWKQPGDNAKFPGTYYWNIPTFSSTYNLFDGSYFKIKQVQLGYTLPKQVLSKVGIGSLRVYASLENFLCFTISKACTTTTPYTVKRSTIY